MSSAGDVTGEPRGSILCAGLTIEGIQPGDDAQGLSVWAVQASYGTTSRRLELGCKSRAEAERWVALIGSAVRAAASKAEEDPSPGTAGASSKVRGLKRSATIRMEEEDQKEASAADSSPCIVALQV